MPEQGEKPAPEREIAELRHEDAARGTKNPWLSARRDLEKQIITAARTLDEQGFSEFLTVALDLQPGSAPFERAMKRFRDDFLRTP